MPGIENIIAAIARSVLNQKDQTAEKRKRVIAAARHKRIVFLFFQRYFIWGRFYASIMESRSVLL